MNYHQFEQLILDRYLRKSHNAQFTAGRQLLDEDDRLSLTDSHLIDEELSGNEIHEEEPSEMDLAKENHLQAEIVTVESPEIGPANNVKGTAQQTETRESSMPSKVFS